MWSRFQSAPLTSIFSTSTRNMEKLEPLSSIARLSERVVRVLGQNPGKFTLQGTNTYIIGKQNPYTLIDTGEGREEYVPVLESALRGTSKPLDPNEPDVSDIIISHWHRDHVGGLPTVLALLRRLWDERNSPLPFKAPRLHKYPLPFNGQTTAFGTHNMIPSIFETLAPDLYTPSPQGTPFHDLYDSQILPGSLQVLHTPGHTTDSICLYIPDDRALYTADTVLGQGTAVFEDLAVYITSLRKMLEFRQPNVEAGRYTLLYPGHGPVVSDGPELISTYIKHRLEREDQIVATLKSPPSADVGVGDTMTTSASPLWTTWTLVASIYASYPESLWLPAAHSVDLHLKKLESEEKVKRVGGEGKDTIWAFVE